MDQALRDRFVCGLQNNSIRRRLLAERKLTLKSANELAKTTENADLERQIISTDIKTENVNAMNNVTRKCYRCNATKHLANACRFKDTKCNNCHMKGHISKACLNRTRQTDPSLKMPAYQKAATPKSTSNIVKQMQVLPTNDLGKILIQIRMRTIRLFTYTKLIQKSHYMLPWVFRTVQLNSKLILVRE